MEIRAIALLPDSDLIMEGGGFPLQQDQSEFQMRGEAGSVASSFSSENKKNESAITTTPFGPSGDPLPRLELGEHLNSGNMMFQEHNRQNTQQLLKIEGEPSMAEGEGLLSKQLHQKLPYGLNHAEISSHHNSASLMTAMEGSRQGLIVQPQQPQQQRKPQALDTLFYGVGGNSTSGRSGQAAMNASDVSSANTNLPGGSSMSLNPNGLSVNDNLFPQPPFNAQQLQGGGQPINSNSMLLNQGGMAGVLGGGVGRNQGSFGPGMMIGMTTQGAAQTANNPSGSTGLLRLNEQQQQIDAQQTQSGLQQQMPTQNIGVAAQHQNNTAAAAPSVTAMNSQATLRVPQPQVFGGNLGGNPLTAGLAVQQQGNDGLQNTIGSAGLANMPFTKKPRKKRAKSFPEKLLDALAAHGNEEAVAWLPDGKSFVVVNDEAFVSLVLSKAFKASKYSSFVRKLHRWGFVRLTSGSGTDCFHHPLFQKDKPELASKITSAPRGRQERKMSAKDSSVMGVEEFMRQKAVSQPTDPLALHATSIPSSGHAPPAPQQQQQQVQQQFPAFGPTTSASLAAPVHQAAIPSAAAVNNIGLPQLQSAPGVNFFVEVPDEPVATDDMWDSDSD